MPAESTSKNAPTKTAFHKVQNFTPTIALTDLIAATTTATITSLIVAPIDKSIMEKALNKRPSVLGGLQDAYSTMFRTPGKFFFRHENNYAAVYRLVWLVYSCTYFSGNVVQSYRESQNQPVYLPKFAAGSVCNVALTLYKDNQMLLILPGKGPELPVPNLSRLLFVIRDCLTVLSSFWIAPLVQGRILVAFPDMAPRQASDIADLTVPATIQFVSTPLHLYGIALKNNPTFTNAQLFQLVRRDYFPAVAARMCRIIPAFGIGMMFQKRFRSEMQDMAEGKPVEWQS